MEVLISSETGLIMLMGLEIFKGNIGLVRFKYCILMEILHHVTDKILTLSLSEQITEYVWSLTKMYKNKVDWVAEYI